MGSRELSLLWITAMESKNSMFEFLEWRQIDPTLHDIMPVHVIDFVF